MRLLKGFLANEKRQHQSGDEGLRGTSGGKRCIRVVEKRPVEGGMTEEEKKAGTLH